MVFSVEQEFVVGGGGGRGRGRNTSTPKNAFVGGYYTGGSEEKIRVLPAGVETTTFWLLVQILYH